ncbi:hypothetical protein SNEBB_009989 [Seison nebaliae]|nr:hypothetical protein SNEBB_009989 [Seison nebaliae]
MDSLDSSEESIKGVYDEEDYIQFIAHPKFQRPTVIIIAMLSLVSIVISASTIDDIIHFEKYQLSSIMVILLVTIMVGDVLTLMIVCFISIYSGIHNCGTVEQMNKLNRLNNTSLIFASLSLVGTSFHVVMFNHSNIH